MSEHGWAAPEQVNLDTGERRTLVRKVAVTNGYVAEVWIAGDPEPEKPVQTPTSPPKEAQ